jgi:hypothetical protein
MGIWLGKQRSTPRLVFLAGRGPSTRLIVRKRTIRLTQDDSAFTSSPQLPHC